MGGSKISTYMSNDLDLDAEPNGQPLVITHSDFMRMMEPAWMKGSVLSDVKAVLKRTCIFIITNTAVYYRPATEQDVDVEGVRLDSSKSLLRQSGGLKYLAYRKGTVIEIFQRTLHKIFNGKRLGSNSFCQHQGWLHNQVSQVSLIPVLQML